MKCPLCESKLARWSEPIRGCGAIEWYRHPYANDCSMNGVALFRTSWKRLKQQIEILVRRER